METVELAYEEFGSQHAATLIILHGFFASARNWRNIAGRLARHYHIYVVDLRNHGGSPHHAMMDYPSMTADVVRFMDIHNIVKSNILGHSMGGKVAMWLALHHGERVNKLIVVDIAPKSYQHSFDKTIQALLNLPLPAIHNRKQAELLLANDIPELEYRQFLLQNLLLKDGGYYWRINLAIFMQNAPNIVAFPEIDRFVAYTKEVLFISGESSTYVALDDVSPLFSKPKWVEVPNAGHWIHAQQPELFMEEVEKFLQSR